MEKSEALAIGASLFGRGDLTAVAQDLHGIYKGGKRSVLLTFAYGYDEAVRIASTYTDMGVVVLPLEVA